MDHSNQQSSASSNSTVGASRSSTIRSSRIKPGDRSSDAIREESSEDSILQSYTRYNNMDEMVSDVTAMAKRYPLLAAGAGAVTSLALGAALAPLFRSSPSRLDRARGHLHDTSERVRGTVKTRTHEAKERLSDAAERGYERGSEIVEEVIETVPRSALIGAAAVALSALAYPLVQSFRRAESRRNPYEEWTHDELYDEAKRRDIRGRSSMSKDELIKALRRDS